MYRINNSVDLLEAVLCHDQAFLARLDKVQEELLYYPRRWISIGVGVGVSKKFNVKVFYVMGKALSGELSCPCDRSCYTLPHVNGGVLFFMLAVRVSVDPSVCLCLYARLFALHFRWIT